MKKLNIEDVNQLLNFGLFQEIAKHSAEKITQADAFGIVISVENSKNGIETFIIKFLTPQGTYLGDYEIINCKPDEFKNGTLIWYHSNKDDVAVFAALHGDGVIDENEHPNI